MRRTDLAHDPRHLDRLDGVVGSSSGADRHTPPHMLYRDLHHAHIARNSTPSPSGQSTNDRNARSSTAPPDVNGVASAVPQPTNRASIIVMFLPGWAWRERPAPCKNTFGPQG